jgi:hypothetical protein
MTLNGISGIFATAAAPPGMGVQKEQMKNSQSKKDGVETEWDLIRVQQPLC